MTEGKVQTNMELTPAERMALKQASGDPYSHGAIVGGVRALLALWAALGHPELPLALPQPEPSPEVQP